jgi:hypothetical protein
MPPRNPLISLPEQKIPAFLSGNSGWKLIRIIAGFGALGNGFDTGITLDSCADYGIIL